MKRAVLAWMSMIVLTGVFPTQAQEVSRTDVLAALAVTDAQLPNVNVSPQPPPVAAPVEKDAYLLALQKMALAQADPELIATLLRYQLAYLSPDNALAAKVMGVVFFEQPELFVRVYSQFPAAAQVLLSPYLKFGFEKAVEGRNLSSPRVKAARKRFDALQSALVNAR